MAPANHRQRATIAFHQLGLGHSALLASLQAGELRRPIIDGSRRRGV
jgi:hypothetical protein